MSNSSYGLRDRGVRPVTCNTWLRALNAFCRWLHERGDLPTLVHLKPLKAEKRLIATLDLQASAAIVGFKPPPAVTVNQKHADGPRTAQKAFAWWRIRALACTLLDVGARESRAEAGERDPADGLRVFRLGGARPPTGMMVACIDAHGIEPICAMLPIAPS